MKLTVILSFVTICIGFFMAVAGAEETLRDGARSAGRTVGGVVHDVGQGAKEVGKGVVKGAKSVGNAAREGGREFRKAVKGEK